MKKTWKLLLVAAVAVLMLFAIAGCGETYKVTIHDGDTTTEAEATSGTKVEKVLADSEITLGDKDEVSPAADEKITADTEITIKRYASVSVVPVEGDAITVELVGGTVGDAIEKAGITLGDGQHPDVDEAEYLTDGETITIVQSNKITLTMDGQTQDYYTDAATVQDFLTEQNITLGDEDTISVDAATAIEGDMEITITRVVIKEETVTEEVPYDTEEEYSSSLYEGDSEVETDGVNGEKEVVYTVRYENGQEVSREVKSETVTKDPVNKVVLIGTKQYSSSSSSSGSSSSGHSSSSYSSGSSSSSSSSDSSSSSAPSGGTWVEDCDGSGNGNWVDENGNIIQ